MTDWTSPAPPLADWRPFDEFVARHERFLLTTHVNPDGDGLGSEVALALALEALGKRVTILNDGALPFLFDFLGESHEFETYDEARARALFAECQALVVLDTSSAARLGRVGAHLATPGLEVAVVDHHLGGADFGHVPVIEKDAAATGELVYDYLRRQPERITPAIAEACYVALATDTGFFRFANTDPPALAMAAHLVSRGADPERIAARVARHRHAGRLRFVGEVLRQLHLDGAERVAWLEARRAEMDALGVRGEDLEGLVDFPRTLPGVEVVVLFTETASGKVKVSLRSAGRVDVCEVAGRFGGGGHRVASGALISGNLAEVRERVLGAVSEALSALGSGTEASGARS